MKGGKEPFYLYIRREFYFSTKNPPRIIVQKNRFSRRKKGNWGSKGIEGGRRGPLIFFLIKLSQKGQFPGRKGEKKDPPLVLGGDRGKKNKQKEKGLFLLLLKDRGHETLFFLEGRGKTTGRHGKESRKVVTTEPGREGKKKKNRLKQFRGQEAVRKEKKRGDHTKTQGKEKEFVNG